MTRLIIAFTFVATCFASRGLAFAGTHVVVETNHGNFEIELNDEKAPISVKNFLNYVDSKFYDNTIIHRVVKNFVVQGGGLTTDMQEKPTAPPIINEAGNGLSNLKGTIGMARESEPNTATSQFYINTKDNTRLDHRDETQKGFGYAVFGQVVSGYEVVEKIEAVQVHTVGEYENVPVETVLVTSIRRK